MLQKNTTEFFFTGTAHLLHILIFQSLSKPDFVDHFIFQKKFEILKICKDFIIEKLQFESSVLFLKAIQEM